jgi:hypothetical protein
MTLRPDLQKSSYRLNRCGRSSWRNQRQPLAVHRDYPWRPGHDEAYPS